MLFLSHIPLQTIFTNITKFTTNTFTIQYTYLIPSFIQLKGQNSLYNDVNTSIKIYLLDLQAERRVSLQPYFRKRYPGH